VQIYYYSTLSKHINQGLTISMGAFLWLKTVHPRFNCIVPFAIIQIKSRYLGAETLRMSLTAASIAWGSTALWAPVTPIRAQNILIASAGKPRRRKAVSVKRRGSSQSENSNNCLGIKKHTNLTNPNQLGVNLKHRRRNGSHF